MARSKPRFRQTKTTGSCPCVPDNDKAMKELASKLAQEEPRFCINDIYNYNINTIPSNEYVDLESYSEVSSFGIHVENLEPDVYPIDVPSMGDQMEEYHSGGNMSSGVPEDSEPNEGSTSFEIRKLNIAETVMSWLDNYGQARGYTLGSHGTSLIINPDEVSRPDSGSADADEAISSKSKTRAVTTRSSASAKNSEGSEIMESACRIILNFHNDLEPLKSARTHGIKWATIQEVLSIWANLMATIWRRSREENVQRSELYGYTQLAGNLEMLALSVSPVDISLFSNPVVRKSFSRIQEFINFALKSSKEFMVIGKMEDSNLGISSWSDSIRTISATVNERLKQTAVNFAQTILKCQSEHSASPKYEIVLHDVIPSKTEAGWMFFGKVELRHLADEDEIKKHINVYPQESGLRITFKGSSPNITPCIDYGAIFHIVNRASLECCQYYENMTKAISEAKIYLEGPLIPISYAKRFSSITRHRQYVMIGQIIAHIQADHAMDSTVEAVDEILRSFNLIIRKSIQVLRQFTKKVRNENEKKEDEGAPFEELVIPMATDCITLLFQTIRRFLALGPCSNTLAENKSALSSVHLCLERGINSLYTTKTSNIFSFHYCVQTLFAISQLSRAEEFAKKAILGSSMKLLIVDRLHEMKRANNETRLAFREVISLVDTRIRTAERYIDIIMKKGAKLGIIVPARTSGVLYSHRHDQYTLIRYSRNSYIRNQAKRLRQSYEVRRHTRKYVVEPDYEEVEEE